MEAWGAGFPVVLLGIPREAPGITRGAQGFPNEVPRGAQGIPREVGFREARNPLAAWMGSERWDSQRPQSPGCLDGLAWLAWLN